MTKAEYLKVWRQEHTDYMQQYHKGYYQKNHELVGGNNKKYYLEHRDELLEYKKEYYHKNKHKFSKLTPYQNRKRSLKNLYKLSLKEYRQLLRKQGYKCALCKMRVRYRLHVDHCHKTNKIRGLLCKKCNFGLGQFNDSMTLLQKAIGYLGRSNGK
jgi:hypothetical protein